MPDDASDSKGLLGRRVSRRWLVVTVTVLVVLIAIVAVTVALVYRSHDRARRAAQATATSTLSVASPYDLVELPAGTNLGKVKDASYVSIYVPNQAGKLTSYGISAEKPAARALSQAVESAEAVTPDVAATLAGAAGGSGGDSTLTFIFPNRETLTFTLDVQHGLIGRGNQAWKPKGDFADLVSAATAGQ